MTPPPPVTYIVPNETTSPKFGQAFSRGCGGRAVNVHLGLQDGDFAAFCTPPTWSLLQQVEEAGRTWYYGDHAFYRRGKFYRITKNARQYIPTDESILHARPDRIRPLGVSLVARWKKDGHRIILCPNSDIYMAKFGFSAVQWAISVADTLRVHTTRHITVRWKQQAQRRPLSMDLADAWAVVVYNSNAAVEALCAGVPVFVLCPWATTASMGLADLSKIETPYYPDLRIPFLWDLANHQWTLAEIQAGIAWRTLHG